MKHKKHKLYWITLLVAMIFTIAATNSTEISELTETQTPCSDTVLINVEVFYDRDGNRQWGANEDRIYGNEFRTGEPWRVVIELNNDDDKYLVQDARHDSAPEFTNVAFGNQVTNVFALKPSSDNRLWSVTAQLKLNNHLEIWQDPGRDFGIPLGYCEELKLAVGMRPFELESEAEMSLYPPFDGGAEWPGLDNLDDEYYEPCPPGLCIEPSDENDSECADCHYEPLLSGEIIVDHRSSGEVDLNVNHNYSGTVTVVHVNQNTDTQDLGIDQFLEDNQDLIWWLLCLWPFILLLILVLLIIIWKFYKNNNKPPMIQTAEEANER